jgi:hypothetical protein
METLYNRKTDIVKEVEVYSLEEVDMKLVHLNGVYINYERKPTLFATLVRVTGLVACIVNLIMIFLLAKNKVKAICFLTHWTVFVTIAELVMSLKCSMASEVNLKDRAIIHTLL